MRKRGLELVEVPCGKPRRGRQRRFSEPFDPRFTHRDLKDPEPVERDADTGSGLEEVEVGWVAIAGRDCKIVRRARCALH